ncbi:MAG: nitrate- and nitrite sensing domain-containing protein [Betaproteobacteria bacterium]|nr:nitrate- and nitrite sensing domain-containing protein [Betaproteobacteria bacterium]
MIHVENLTMRGKLVAVLVLPMFALALFAAHALWQEAERRAGMAELARAATLSLATGDLVHELQAERGRTSLFLARQGRQFEAELARQRTAVDQAWHTLESLQGRATRHDPGLPAGLLTERRAEIAHLRVEVDRVALSPARALENYSLVIRTLLGAIEGLAARTPDAGVAQQFAAYRWLIQAKEAAGQERAEGGRWLAGGADAALATRLIELAAQQTLLLDQFQAQAHDPLRRAWRDAAQADCVRALPALRIALRNAQPATRPGPEIWFDTASCRMERLHDVEAAYARHLADLTSTLDAGSRARLALIVLFALLPIPFSLWLIVRVARNVSGHSRWLLTAMHGIAGGNFNVSLPPASHDELGELAQGLEALRGQLARLVAEQGRQLRRERETGAELERHSLEIQHFAQRIAAGDLAGRLEEDDDTLGRLASSLNHMAEGLAGLAGRVRETGSTLLATVSQMHSAVAAQSSGASEQAASVTQTMTTLEEIRATSTQTLEKAQRLGEMAERARSEGEHGRQVVEESIAGIGEVNLKVDAIARTILSLNERTQRIGEITGAVSGIARQLRLLSLNAAIEATRAGEAGQGFAVVATEVKQLAEQSQTATEQVQRILEEIRHATDRAVMATEDGAKGVERGLAQVQRAGEAIRSLEGVVRDTSLGSRQIVAAVRQESAGIEQIATAMSDIHAVTTRFVTATEQTRAATDELSYLAQRLSAVASLYKV